MKVVITGVKELDRAFKNFEPTLVKKIIRRSFRQALKPMLASAKRNAPRGETGQLEKAIRIKAARRTRKKQIEIDVGIGKKGQRIPAYYAPMVEYGTKKMKARHYLKQTYEATRASTRDLAIDLIKKDIEQTTKELNTGK